MTEKNNVLIVDDSQAIRSYMHAILSTEDWFDDIVLASSADEAMSILDNDDHNIGWVFGDWELDGTPSQALLDHIREHYHKDEICFVMLTERQAKQLALQPLPRDINDYLTKPFEPNMLLNVIRRQRGLPERRIAERVSPIAPYELTLMTGNDTREAELVNISTSGCLVLTERFQQAECSVYDVIGVNLMLSGEHLSLIDAEIVRLERYKGESRSEKRVQVALSFLDITVENKQRLATYIETCEYV